MAGLALGGGYGPLTGRVGMALDSLLGAEVVLADGRVVLADETHEPDLFWALRGGGGNFGVVTSLRVRLHPFAEVWTGAVAFAWKEAQSVLNKYADMVAAIADELTVQPMLVPGPDGKLTVTMLPTWCGDSREDMKILDQIKALGAPVLAQVGRMSYADMLTHSDQLVPDGLCWLIRTVTLARLEPGAVEILIAAAESRSSLLSSLSLHPFCGAGERIPLQSTAFGLRTRHLLVGIYAAWEPGDDTPHRAWADAVEVSLKPYALPGAYPNYFGTDRPEQAAQAYGRNTARLLQIKAHYDPKGVFNATSLPTVVPALTV